MTDADVGAAGRGRQPLACPQCGTQIAPALLACPSCQRLVHSDALKRLAAEAERTAHAGDMSAALAAWRQALELLPPDATQHTVVSARILELSRALDSRPAATKHGSPWGKGAAGVGAVGALLAKFKFVLLFVLTKAKLLLLGLTKGGTFLSMLLSAGLYWTIWGWKFAFGLVLSIYIHLYPRNGSRAGVATLRHQGHSANVHPRVRRRDPAQAVSGGRARRRARRARRSALGAGRCARGLRGVSCHGRGGMGSNRAHGRVGESFQPGSGVAARRRAGLPRADPPTALDRGSGHRGAVVRDVRRAAGAARARRRGDRRVRSRVGRTGSHRAAAVCVPRERLVADDPDRGACHRALNGGGSPSMFAIRRELPGA